MAASKPQSRYRLVGLATASTFLALFAFTMYKLNRAGSAPHQGQLKNGYATMDDSYLDPPKKLSVFESLLAKRQEKTAAKEEQPAKPKQRFEFYSVLPDFQVDVPTDNDRLRREATQRAQQARDANVSQPRIVQVQTKSQPARVIATQAAGAYLQAGSFIDMSDARKRRADVIMLGLQAHVESAQVRGQLYHRVKLGPYADNTQRQRAQQRLVTAGIDAIVKAN